MIFKIGSLKLKTVNFKENNFAKLAAYGLYNNSILDKVCAFLFVLSPILQHYVGIYRNAGFTVLVLILPYLSLKLCAKFMSTGLSFQRFSLIFPLLLFQIYRLFDHGINLNKLLYAVFMFLVLMIIACGCINVREFFRYATVICVCATFLLIVQYLFFYLLRIHITMVPTFLFLPESSQWLLLAKTGLYGITGTLNTNNLYRPSAFFLEPSHLFVFSFPVLCLLLLSPEMDSWRKKVAYLVTLGIILSTSGMGLFVAIGLWSLYWMFYRNGHESKVVAKLRNFFSFKSILILFCALLVLVFLYFQVGAFTNMVNRVFGIDNSVRWNAIDGRTRLAQKLILGLRDDDLLFGFTEDKSDIEFNLPGFFSTVYKYGIAGVCLSYLFNIRSYFKLKGASFWVNCLVVLLSFFTAHTHGVFYMLYFLVLL